MERLTAKRKERLLNLYGDKVRPITKAQTEWCLKDTARYIWFTEKNAYNGHCERCGNDVTYDTKTRHNADITCPKCRAKLKVRHDWRMTQTYHTDWRAIIKVLDESEVLIRYVLITTHNRERTVKEVAREVLNFDTETRRELETTDWDGEGSWRIGNKHKWFTEYSMNFQYRSLCCLQADPCKLGLVSELRKCNRFKYLKNPLEYFSNSYYVTSEVHWLAEKANVFEKLEKVGLKELATQEFKRHMSWYGQYDAPFDYTQTTLVGALRLTKTNYNRLFKYKSLKALGLMQRHPNVKNEILDYISTNEISIDVYDVVRNINAGHELKMLKYISENKLNTREYEHYVSLLRDLEYKLDKAYLFPKDCRTADARVTDEYQKNRSKIEAKKLQKQDGLIKAISDGLRKMDDLQEFLKGSDGLLVYVPESSKDLEKEGKALHNCIGTYAKRIAEGKTLVFFVRRLNDLKAPFVAFEYVNGDVVQCRADNNEQVKDDKIISFVDAFAERLRKNNILYKAA